MLRFIIYAGLILFVSRALFRFWAGLMEGMSGQIPGSRASSVPQRGVQMARDPVCGTFVVPDGTVTLSVGRQVLHFCSTACRDKYRATARGRTA